MKRRIATAVLSLAILFPTQGQAETGRTQLDADPALFMIRDSDTTIYLFGTVHLLPDGLSWFDEAVREAFDASGEVYLEALLPEDPETLAPVLRTLAFDPAGRTLSSRLSRPERRTVSEGLKKLGVSLAEIDPLEPWFAAVQIAALIAIKSGFDPEKGADALIEAEARSAGKALHAFETAEEQLRMLDSAPEAEQVGGLVKALADPDKAIGDLIALLQSWTDGDPDRTGALMNTELAESPVTARLLLEDRNERWAEVLATRMQAPGTVFVAVGAGHIAGQGSLNEALARRGFVPERIPY